MFPPHILPPGVFTNEGTTAEQLQSTRKRHEAILDGSSNQGYDTTMTFLLIKKKCINFYSNFTRRVRGDITSVVDGVVQ